MHEAMTKMGMTDPEKMAVYTLVAAVLHMGNISFEENHEDSKGGCRACILKVEAFSCIKVWNIVVFCNHKAGSHPIGELFLGTS